MSSVQLELHRSKEAGQPYYTMIRSTRNGKVIYWSENYTSRQKAINAGKILQSDGLQAKFVDKTAVAS